MARYWYYGATNGRQHADTMEQIRNRGANNSIIKKGAKMKIRNKKTGQIFEVLPGTLYPDFFEEVKNDDIKIGEPTVEYVIEEEKVEKPKKTTKKTTKRTKKGAKKNETSKK